MRRLVQFLVVVALLVVAVADYRAEPVGQETYDLVRSGMSCKQNSMDSLECDYRVGRSLHFNIAGIGERDAGITFYGADFDGDFYASVGVLHGCVIVKPGRLKPNMIDFAFVSPRDGKVYRDWETCGNARR